MKQFRDKERQETVSNGYAPEMGYEAEARVKEMANMALTARPEVRGLAALAGGLLLLAHTLGYFPLLNWALAALGVAGVVYGATTSTVWSKIKQAIEYVRQAVTGRTNSAYGRTHSTSDKSERSDRTHSGK